MKRLATAVRTASLNALNNVNLESLADSMVATDISMERHCSDLDDLTLLAQGLESVVVTFESIDTPSSQQRDQARDQALTYLQMSGLSAKESSGIVPSLEAQNDSAWEKFKAFIIKLWQFVVIACKKIFEFVDTLFKKTSLAEKASMMQLRALKKELTLRQNGLTTNATLPLRPAHRYLFNSKNKIEGIAGLQANIKQYRATRDAIQKTLPREIEKVINGMVTLINKLNVTGDAATTSASVEAILPEVISLVQVMFPDALAKTLGATRSSGSYEAYRLPLIYDRAVEISNPFTNDEGPVSDKEVAQYLSQLGTSVVQVQTPELTAESYGMIPALKIGELAQWCKTAEELIDTGLGTDNQRQWAKLRLLVDTFAIRADSVLKDIIKQKELSDEARVTLRLLLNARQAMSRWASAPYTQLSTVNIRVTQSLLALIADQIKNYEVTDGLQERTDKAAEAENERKAVKNKDGK